MNEYHVEMAMSVVWMLLMVGCGIAMAVKLRASPAASVLGAVGFAVVVLADVIQLAIVSGMGRYDRDFFLLMRVVRLLGFVGVFVGLLLARSGAAPQAAWVHAPSVGMAKMGQMQVSSRRPGWGLVIGWIVCSAVTLLFSLGVLGLVISAGRYINRDEEMMIFVALGLTFLSVVPSTILYLVWLYTAWDSVPEQHRSATPGQAVGFLFIPFFNFYWVFRAVAGLSASLRRSLQEREGPHAGDAGYGMAIATCVVAVIPYVNILSWPLFLIWVCMANAAKNRVLRNGQHAAG